MIFTPTKIAGVWIVEPERHEDARGWFARTWCEEEFASHGLQTVFLQCSTSYNKLRGTLRGMHYQAAPHEEDKLVRCTRGAAYDVALDLRPQSPTYLQWVSAELSVENGRALYIPKGCAHGFQTLANDTEIFYHISEPFKSGSGCGVRWNDPLFNISWPLPDIAILSERDANLTELHLWQN